MKEFLDATKDTHKAKEYFLNEMAYTLGPIELKHMIEHHLDLFNLIDVRMYDDYIKGHIPYATHIPYEQMEKQWMKLSKDKINIVYCYSIVCHLGKKAAYKIASNGYPVMELTGGFASWKKHDLEIIEEDMSDYPG